MITQKSLKLFRKLSKIKNYDSLPACWREILCNITWLATGKQARIFFLKIKFKNIVQFRSIIIIKQQLHKRICFSNWQRFGLWFSLCFFYALDQLCHTTPLNVAFPPFFLLHLSPLSCAAVSNASLLQLSLLSSNPFQLYCQAASMASPFSIPLYPLPSQTSAIAFFYLCHPYHVASDIAIQSTQPPTWAIG